MNPISWKKLSKLSRSPSTMTPPYLSASFSTASFLSPPSKLPKWFSENTVEFTTLSPVKLWRASSSSTKATSTTMISKKRTVSKPPKPKVRIFTENHSKSCPLKSDPSPASKDRLFPEPFTCPSSKILTNTTISRISSTILQWTRRDRLWHFIIRIQDFTVHRTTSWRSRRGVCGGRRRRGEIEKGRRVQRQARSRTSWRRRRVRICTSTRRRWSK